MTVANFPNYISETNPFDIFPHSLTHLYLVFNGPFGPYSHGSFLPITETVSRYLMQILTKMSEEDVSSFAPKEGAVADFVEHRRKFLPHTAWTSPCRSWFKGGTINGEPMM